MPRWLIFFIVLFTVLDSHAWEQGETSGKIEVRSGYFLSHDQGYPNAMGQSFYRVENSLTQGNFAVKAAPALTMDTQNMARLDQTRYHVKSSEAWGDYTTDEFGVSAGQQMIKWGTADGFNPTNVFKAYDFSDPVFPRDLSQGALAFNWHPAKKENLVFELVYVPSGTVDYLPFNVNPRGSVDPTRSRWGSAFPSQVDFNQSFQIPLRYAVDGPHHNPAWDGALRMRLLQIKQWDYSFVVGKFRRKRAIIRYNLQGDANDPNLPLTVHMSPYYGRYSLVGFDAAGTVGDIGVRFEAARYFVEQNSKAFGYDSFIANLGADYTFSEFLFGSELYLNGSVVYINNTRYAQYDNQSFDLAFTRSYITPRAEMRWTKWRAGSDLLLTAYGGSIFNLYSKYEMNTRLTLGLTANFISGSGNSGIGRLSDNHRLIGNVEYFF